MSIYTQQINNMVEQLPVSEQQFIAELVKVSINHFRTKKRSDSKLPDHKQAIRNFIDGINAVTDEPLDEEFDEIVRDRMNITRELDL